MNKLMLIKGRIVVCLMLTCLQLAQGCKKDPLLPNEPAKKKDVEISNVPYLKFLNSINLDATGSLKSVLTGERQKLMSVEKSVSDFTIETDSVGKLVVKDTVSYILSIKPRTPRAVQFQNITIQVAKGKTTAFLSTYFPDKEWLDQFRSGNKTGFKGNASFNKIYLDEFSQNPKITNSSGASGLKDRILASISTNGGLHPKTISLAPGECEIYTQYIFTAIPCKHGHLSRANCNYYATYGTWDNVPGDSPPSVTITTETIVNCGGPDVGAGTGSGGGGNTVPTPPPSYNPCDGNPQSISANFERGTRLAALPPTECDPLAGMPEGADPSFSTNAKYLFELLPISDEYRKNFLHTHPALTNELVGYLSANGETNENRAFITWAIGYLAYGQNNNYSDYSSLITVLQPNQNIDPAIYRIYFSIQCAIIKTEHPEYPEWRVAWEASQEMVHLLLDGVGMVPGIGEIADLTNGAIYAIQGDGVNATLSAASAIPFVGWWTMGAKYAKKTLNLANGTKITLQWIRKAGNVVNFGDRAQLRKVLNLLPGDLRQAHHIIPWDKQTHAIVQKAAKRNGSSPFHMNDVLNGIAVASWRNQPNHNAYNNLIRNKLDALPNNLTPDEAYSHLMTIVNEAKQAIINNPNTHLNDLIF